MVCSPPGWWDIYYMILETGIEDCKSGDTVVYNIVDEKKKSSKLVDKMLRDVSI